MAWSYRDFNHLCNWCCNDLQVNLNKYFSISFFCQKPPFVINYYSDSYFTSKINTVKDPGIIFTNSLSFNVRLQTMLMKTSRSLDFIIRNTHVFYNILSLKTLCFALLNPRIQLYFGNQFINWLFNLFIQLSTLSIVHDKQNWACSEYISHINKFKKS